MNEPSTLVPVHKLHTGKSDAVHTKILEMAKQAVSELHEPWSVNDRYDIAERFLNEAYELGRSSVESHIPVTPQAPEKDPPHTGETDLFHDDEWGV